MCQPLFFKQRTVSVGMPQKGLKQVADIQHNIPTVFRETFVLLIFVCLIFAVIYCLQFQDAAKIRNREKRNLENKRVYTVKYLQ